MFDLGWSELLIIGVAALIVVGPKDLPKMLRTLGQYAGKARSIAREFQRSMDEAARQADIEELREVKKDLDTMRQAQHKLQRDMSKTLLDIPSNPSAKSDKKAGAKPAADAGAGSEPAAAAPEPVKKPAKEPAKESAKTPAKTAPGPKTEPDNVSGA